MSSVATKCVLVVDDDYTIRELISDVLQRKGYYVEMADNGQQALAQVRLTQPDAIVLDLMMPVMDGWAFLEQYRTDPLWGHRPVVLMSAYTKLQQTASALDVQGILAKPFDLNDLLDTVERLLQGP